MVDTAWAGERGCRGPRRRRDIDRVHDHLGRAFEALRRNSSSASSMAFSRSLKHGVSSTGHRRVNSWPRTSRSRWVSRPTATTRSTTTTILRRTRPEEPSCVVKVPIAVGNCGQMTSITSRIGMSSTGGRGHPRSRSGARNGQDVRAVPIADWLARAVDRFVTRSGSVGKIAALVVMRDAIVIILGRRDRETAEGELVSGQNYLETLKFSDLKGSQIASRVIIMPALYRLIWRLES